MKQSRIPVPRSFGSSIPVPVKISTKLDETKSRPQTAKSESKPQVQISAKIKSLKENIPKPNLPKNWKSSAVAKGKINEKSRKEFTQKSLTGNAGPNKLKNPASNLKIYREPLKPSNSIKRIAPSIGTNSQRRPLDGNSKVKQISKNPVRNTKDIVKSTSANANKRILPSTAAPNPAKKTGNTIKTFSKVQQATVKPKINKTAPQAKKPQFSNRAESGAVIQRAEKILVVKEKVNDENFEENDDAFKSSGFYKNLILSGRELSPGMIKLCSTREGKIETPIRNHITNFSAKSFIEDLKRNSARFRSRKGKLQMSPHLDNNRRWTSEIQNNFLNLENMKVTEIAAEIRRQSEMRRESSYQQQNHLNIRSPFQHSNMTPRQETLKKVDVLLYKKKEKIKKKVTFNIPSLSSPELATREQKSNFESVNLPTIIEKSNRESTPDFIAELLKNKLNRTEKTFNSAINKKVGDDSVNTTPELNLHSFKTVDKPSSDTDALKVKRQSATPELDLKTLNVENIPGNDSSEIDPPSDTDPSQQQTVLETDTHENLHPIVLRSPKVHIVVSPASPTIIESLCDLKITSHPSLSKPKRFVFNASKNIFTPQPISLYSASRTRDSSISPHFQTGKSVAVCAPICTPFVLKSMAKMSDVSPIRQRLNFEEEPKLSDERRESQIFLRRIPTFYKMQDVLCDQECNILSMQSATNVVPFFRPLPNPVASVLSDGDEMHFVPVNSPF